MALKNQKPNLHLATGQADPSIHLQKRGQTINHFVRAHLGGRFNRVIVGPMLLHQCGYDLGDLAKLRQLPPLKPSVRQVISAKTGCDRPTRTGVGEKGDLIDQRRLCIVL